MIGPHSITLIRHGEKPDEHDPTKPPFGVDATGAQNPHSLVPTGWQRAKALAALFAATPVRAPFVRPTMLVAPDYAGAEAEHRPYQTLMPASALLGLPIQTPIPEDAEAELAGLLTQLDAADVLVCWEHHRIPTIVAGLATAFGLKSVPPIGTLWPDDDFSSALIFTLGDAGVTAVQAHEAVLPGDPQA